MASGSAFKEEMAVMASPVCLAYQGPQEDLGCPVYRHHHCHEFIIFIIYVLHTHNGNGSIPIFATAVCLIVFKVPRLLFITLSIND